MSPFLWLFFIGLFVFLSRKKLLRRIEVIKAVEQLPGPLSIPILGTTWQFKWSILGLVHQLRAWALRYSLAGHGVIRVWLGMRPLIVVFSADYAKEILESQSMITKGPEYSIITRWLGTGLLTSTGEKWRTRRKMITPAFHFNILNQFISIFSDQGKVLVEQLEEHANGKEFDVFPFMKRCALDIICETSMGTSVSAQINRSHGYVHSVQRLNELAFMHERMPWLWFDPLWYAFGYGQEWDRHIGLVRGFTTNVIRNRKQEYLENKNDEMRTKRKKAFLDLLLEMQKENGLSDEDIREEVDTFMFEGHDTTSASMGWTIWCVAHDQLVQKQIHEEMDAIFGNSDRECTIDDLSRMKYLEKVTKESLRLFPSVPNISRLPEKDTVINGTMIPKECTVLISPFAIHRDPKYFPNPEAFDPSNFNDEAVRGRPAYTFVPFSAGPRNCIGQKFALMEEKAVLSWFFRRFHISSHRDFYSNIPLPEIVSKPMLGFPVHLSLRTND